jgi:hypothetical protein
MYNFCLEGKQYTFKSRKALENKIIKLALKLTEGEAYTGNLISMLKGKARTTRITLHRDTRFIKIDAFNGIYDEKNYFYWTLRFVDVVTENWVV